jgi:hypothetical protein
LIKNWFISIPILCDSKATRRLQKANFPVASNPVYCRFEIPPLTSTGTLIRQEKSSRMPNRLSAFYLTTAFFALGLLALPSSAFAGFQWIAPPDNAAPAPQSMQQQPMQQPQAWPAAPVARAPMPATAAPEIISPVIITGNSAPAPTAMPAPVAAPSNSYTPSPASSMNSGIMPAPTPAAMPSATSSTDVVRGFAKQVPLAVALRQILPAGYGFSVDPDVDLGVLISFQGGKPWRDTLRDALEPAGLTMHEQGQMVTVGHPATTAMTENVAAPAPLPAPHTVDMSPGSAVQAVDVNKGPAIEDWHAERGDNLHKVIENWAARAHIELNWVAEYDYPLQASYSYTGTFEDAVRNLLTGFEDAHPQPIAELHTNPGLGIKVLIVQTRGNSYSD